MYRSNDNRPAGTKFSSFVRRDVIPTSAPVLLGHTSTPAKMAVPTKNGTWKVVITIVQGDGTQTDFTYVQKDTTAYFASTNALREFVNSTDYFVREQISDVVASYQYHS